MTDFNEARNDPHSPAWSRAAIRGVWPVLALVAWSVACLVLLG